MMEHVVCNATTGTVLTFKIIHNCNSNNPLNKKMYVILHLQHKVLLKAKAESPTVM